MSEKSKNKIKKIQTPKKNKDEILDTIFHNSRVKLDKDLFENNLSNF